MLLTKNGADCLEILLIIIKLPILRNGGDCLKFLLLSVNYLCCKQEMVVTVWKFHFLSMNYLYWEIVGTVWQF